MVVRLLGRMMDCSAVHPRKVSRSIVMMLGGRIMDVRDEQYWNAADEI